MSTNGHLQNDGSTPFVQQSNSCAYQTTTHITHTISDGIHNGGMPQPHMVYSHNNNNSNMPSSNSTQYSSSPGSISGSTHHSHSPYTPTNMVRLNKMFLGVFFCNQLPFSEVFIFNLGTSDHTPSSSNQ